MNTTVSTNVTAGLGGFLAFFLLALALWLLMRNMNARLRRMSFREEAEAKAGGAPAAPGAGAGAGAAGATHATDEADEDSEDDEAGSDGQVRRDGGTRDL